MNKTVILITGTPGVGKTTVAKKLAAKLDALYLNLTKFAESHNLMVQEDKQRKTRIIDEEKMLIEMKQTIDASDNQTIVVDGHYAPAVVPKNYVSHILILRRNPVELRRLMEGSGFQGNKIWENLASEILDTCLVEALQQHGKEKVCELDITGKEPETVVNEICLILSKKMSCYVGCVDWLGILEREGLTDEYLRI
jgi:adenylate kinase